MGVMPVSDAARTTVSVPVPDAVAPPPGNPRFPMIDGLRATAALLVLASHTIWFGSYDVLGYFRNWTTLLDLGVTLFFLLSGFLLYRPFVSADLSGREPLKVVPYYRRRLLRIVPAYWVALTVLSLVPHFRPATFEHWFRYYFFLQIYFPFEKNGGISQAWSLCVEMSFYLVLPAYAAGMRFVQRRSGPRIRVRVDAIALLVLSALSVPVMLYWNWNVQKVGLIPWAVGLPRFLFWFALGMGLALCSAALREGGGAETGVISAVRRHPLVSWAVAAVIFLVAGFMNNVSSAGARLGAADETRFWVAGGLISFFLLIPAVFPSNERSLPGRLMTSRLMAWLGLVSYGIFLWHVAALEFLYERITKAAWHGLAAAQTFANQPTSLRALGYSVLTLLITVPIAALSYYLVEKPFLRLKFKKKPV